MFHPILKHLTLGARGLEFQHKYPFSRYFQLSVYRNWMKRNGMTYYDLYQSINSLNSVLCSVEEFPHAPPTFPPSARIADLYSLTWLTSVSDIEIFFDPRTSIVEHVCRGFKIALFSSLTPFHDINLAPVVWRTATVVSIKHRSNLNHSMIGVRRSW